MRRKTRSCTLWDRARNRKFRRLLLAWYDLHKRALPWRSNPSPYRVWVSEIMLQQTQVATVLPYYRRFLRRFPDVPSLASAREEEVLELWAGLGYYSRGRNLHRAARKIVEEHGGRFPSRMVDTLSLPGIGRYTACAIQSIAFNRREPVVDGNVKRVASRLCGIASGGEEKFFWEQAAAWVPRGRPADFNQALMELGALICVPRRPKCPECPVRPLCAALRDGIQDSIPAPRPRREPEEVTLVVLAASRPAQLLMCRQASGSLAPGVWGLPTRAVKGASDPGRAARRFVRELFGKRLTLRSRGQVNHAITYRKIVAHVFEVEGSEIGEVRPPLRWVAADRAVALLTSSLYRKIWSAAAGRRFVGGRLGAAARRHCRAGAEAPRSVTRGRLVCGGRAGPPPGELSGGTRATRSPGSGPRGRRSRGRRSDS